jgi:arylsulfatase A-like enzyme
MMQLKNSRYKNVFMAASICLLVFGLLMANFAFTDSSKPKKPNIIVIVVDDAGYADFGFKGSKDLLTPNIDALAANGIVFSDAHVSATVCSPSRAGLLAGKYQQRFGHECNESPGYTGMDPKQILMPALLKQHGYATAAFGKWHLGYEQNQQPLQKGFQHYYGFLSGGRSYFYKAEKDDKAGAKTALLENNLQVKFDGYLTDVLGEKAAAYIDKNSNTPFYIYWAPNAVHTPMEAAEEDMKRFANHPRQKLAAMTFALDRAVGKMVDALKKNGILENTMIVFLSDNGGAHNNQSDNTPLKGFKGNKFEAGHRVPFFISWPKQLKPQKNFTGLTSSLDVYPTVLAAAGIKKPAALQLDGVSLLPYLKSKVNGAPHEELVWRKDAEMAVRYKNYKLIHVRNFDDRLYDLKKDPGETTDIKQEKPAVYQMLKQKLKKWQADKIQPIWTEGAVWDTITLMIHDDLFNNRKVRVYSPEDLQKFKKIKGQ